MAIELDSEARRRALASIKRYLEEQMDDPEVGDLKATLLLEFFLREIGPTVYNGAVRDAQAWFQEKVGDLDGSCFEPEFDYWK